MNSKNKTQGSALFTLVSGIVIVVAVVVLLIKLASSGSYADVDATTKEATETRIMPTGQLVVGAPKDIAPAPAATPVASSDASAPASDAAGASAVILLCGSADVYSGKVVRATMGSLFHIPFAAGISTEELIRFAGSEGMDLLAAACDANAKPHFSADLCRPAVIVFGNEANGASEELLRVSEHIYIPMRGRAESLNVATAATAVLYEALRQRMAKVCHG